MPGDPPFAADRIRLAHEADIPALAEMINAAFAIEEFLEGTRTDSNRLAEQLQTGQILLLESASGQLQACVYTELRGERGYMGMLAVAPCAQGTGLARRLVEAAEEHFRQQGLRELEISVLSLRPELLPIYRRWGFEETGTEPFHFPRTVKNDASCHCIVMTKQL
jgi:ribosomal protein S18 acetylase RimI-like enzyme